MKRKQMLFVAEKGLYQKVQPLTLYKRRFHTLFERESVKEMTSISSTSLFH